MTLTANKLTPSTGMHLQRISDGSVSEGEIWIPPALVDDFREITHEEYLKLTQEVDTDNTLENRISKLEEQNKILEQQSRTNADDITNLQEAICEVYESII